MTATQLVVVGLEFIPLIGMCRSDSRLAAALWLAVGAALAWVPFIGWW